MDKESKNIDTNTEYLIFNIFRLVGSISFEVIGILHWRSPSDPTMILESTQTLIENNTKNISRREGWQPYYEYVHVPIV